MNKLKGYVALTKITLSFLVVLSATICYAIAAKDFSWTTLVWLALGGFLVTGSSNGINQVIEKDLDKLMKRTQQRPLVTGVLNVTEAFVFSVVLGIIGIAILFVKINVTSGILGLTALLLYTVVYTPLKRESPFCVFIGAFPGSVPPMLGWVAATNNLSEVQPWIMFGIQFLWQFPHFWAIAWRLDEDYKKAGFLMLPSGNRDNSSAFQIVVYTLSLVPMSLLPVFFGVSGYISAAIISIAGIVFSWQAISFYKHQTMEKASSLMFGSFIYLPVVQFAMLVDKI